MSSSRWARLAAAVLAFSTGRAVAVLFTNAHGRIPGPGLATLDPDLTPA